MDRQGIRRHIEATCPGIEVLEDEAGSWFFVVPGPRNPHKIPFATVTVSDRYDPGSDLERRGLFRLNLGIGVAAYTERFGKPLAFPKGGGVAEPGRDYAVADRLMPHPVYAAMGWVCVVQPSAATFEGLKPLVAAAYAAGRAV
jgi:hypothetical protein